MCVYTHVWERKWFACRLWMGAAVLTVYLCSPLFLHSICSAALVAQLCLTLSTPMDYSMPGSSAHGIFQAKILEWVPLPSPGSFGPRDWTQVSHIAGRSFTIWATREVPVFALKLFLNFWLRLAACRILAFNQRSNLCPLHWEHGVLTTGSPHYKHHLIKIQLIPATLIL